MKWKAGTFRMANRKFLFFLGYSSLPLRLRRKIFIYLRMLPRTALSNDFRQQVRLLRLHFPEVPLRPHVIWIRNWGNDASLALTQRFDITDEDLASAGPHAEVDACMAGEKIENDYFENLIAQHGWSRAAAEERRDKTRFLLTQDAREFVSEVIILGNGKMQMHDGNHRASIRRRKGFTTQSVIVSLNLDLK